MVVPLTRKAEPMGGSDWLIDRSSATSSRPGDSSPEGLGLGGLGGREAQEASQPSAGVLAESGAPATGLG